MFVLSSGYYSSRSRFFDRKTCEKEQWSGVENALHASTSLLTVMSKVNKSVNRPPTPEPEEPRELTLEESVQLKVPRKNIDLL